VSEFSLSLSFSPSFSFSLSLSLAEMTTMLYRYDSLSHQRSDESREAKVKAGQQ